ncbi:MAG: phosphoribosyltransferase, partial [Rhodococcus sp. (in: high G+C Gram-positive bacteria)]|nr:phosphoribosyltransferase [Rhodococcus sp. (in: high G+C Gram-positive bacteria)]
RVSGLVDVWEVPDMSIHQGPILLVDAIADTGWTFTMASRALRQAGAHSVLPLALASPK